MALYAIIFYILSAVLIAASVMVIAVRNPVHAVLFLILAFVNAAGLFLMAGAEFLAIILIVVYVGAVAVLFLFVVMMLDIDLRDLARRSKSYLPLSALIGVILLLELLMMATAWLAAEEPLVRALGERPISRQITNTEALGQVLYTDYLFLFQTSGVILLVAMIGAIVLSLRTRKGVLRQSISQQINRTREESVEVKDVPSGSGV